MTALFDLRHDHIKRQKQAANPQKSVFVSANAGSGKTRVLVDRIIRMLLPPFNVPPYKILCVTFTKAAASEMAQRLFARLGEWIILSDTALSQEIIDLSDNIPTPEDLILARRLFAKALETPGGLKIQTIHGFCEHILRKFPVEAGIRADFTVLEDALQNTLFEQALDDIALAIKHLPHHPLSLAIESLGLVITRHDILDLLSQSYKTYGQCKAKNIPFNDKEILADFLDLMPNETYGNILQIFIESLDWEKLQALESAFADGEATDKKTAEKLMQLIQNRLSAADRIVEICEEIFLTSAGEERKRFYTKKLEAKYPQQCRYMAEFAQAFLSFYEKSDRMRLYEMTQAITLLATSVYDYYHTIKKEKGMFDFDDLIEHTRTLLYSLESSAWVLYKLDGGISHILLDEAQDTSPAQWDIIRRLAEEFFVETTQDQRTIFAVGDEKQSIYSFQGADPSQMAYHLDIFKTQSFFAKAGWLETSLHGSFRSAPAIMALVDAVFSHESTSEGVQFHKNQKIEHHAVANAGPGMIELFPPIIPHKSSEESVWTAPLDKPAPESAPALVARQVVQNIKTLLQSGDILPSTRRPISPSDIMILLKKRGTMMRLLIKELKKQNIPVAGADRISLLSEIAVLDLCTAIDFVLMPEDDLTLAVLLKSPLCGFSEEELYDIAHARDGTLWHSLIKHKESSAFFIQTYDFLQKILNYADRTTPYEFLCFILDSCEGRKKFHSRLGKDCLDTIEEFLNKAMRYECDHNPSLQGFVHYVRHFESDVKREAEQSTGDIRVMTVHGAKGLEAPIIFLPDACDPFRMNELHKNIILPDIAIPLWLKEGVKNQKALDVKEQIKKNQEYEYRRLLYVALTRAKDRLYISGSLAKSRSEDKHSSLPEKCWYHYIRNGLKSLEGVVITDNPDYPEFPKFYYRDQGDMPTPAPLLQETPKHTPPLPNFINTIPLETQEIIENITPSTALGDIEMDSGIPYLQEAIQRGKILHRLLELLPPLPEDKRDNAIDNFLHRQNLDSHKIANYKQEISKVLNYPEAKEIFAPHGLSEATIMGKPSALGGITVSGQIDRLVINEDKILIADYKTDRTMTETSILSSAYILQLALYKTALQDIYPDRPIKCFLIGTAKPCIRSISEESMTKALETYLIKRKKVA